MSKLIARRKAEWNSMMKVSIAEVAVTVLNEYGINGLTMDRVAEAAEVAKGTLYNYFNNKDELVLSAMDIKFKSIRQELLDIQNSKSSPPEKMKNVIRSLLIFFKNERAFQVVINAAEGLSLPVRNHAAYIRETLIRIIAEIVEDGIKKRFFKKYNTLQVAKLIYSAAHSYFRIIIKDKNDLQSFDEVNSDFSELFFSGILKMS